MNELFSVVCSIDYFVHIATLLLTNFLGFVFELQLTDFKKLLEAEAAKSKAASSSVPQNDPHIRQFREAVWVCMLRFWTKF